MELHLSLSTYQTRSLQIYFSSSVEKFQKTNILKCKGNLYANSNCKIQAREKLSSKEAIARVRDFCILNIRFLDNSEIEGKRITSIEETVDGFVLTTQWDESIVDDYKALMNGISEEVKEKLRSEGWTITFNPETADL